MKRAARWALLRAGLAGVIAVGTATTGGATPPAGLTQIPLARGTNVSTGAIPLKFGTDIVMAQITVQPGGSSGWHSHPGGAIVVVKEGSLTVHRSIGHQCQIETYGRGQAFVEQPGEVDQVTNMGTAPYTLYVTFPRVPQGESARTDVPDPGTCSGL